MKGSTTSVCPRKSLQAKKSPYATDANGLTQLKIDHGYGQRVFTTSSNGVLGELRIQTEIGNFD